MEVDAKIVVLKNLDGEYLVPYTVPYTGADGVEVKDNVVSLTEEIIGDIYKPAAIIKEW